MFTIIVGGSHDFIKECRESTENVDIKILKEASSIEDAVSLIQKLVPHAVLIPGEWAPKAASLVNKCRNTKIFVSGGIEKSWRDEWDEKGLPVFIVSGKTYKALMDIEAHLKFSCPTNFQPEEFSVKNNEEISCKDNKIKFKIPKLPKIQLSHSQNKEIRYISHHIIVVWSPVGGSIKSTTSLNLAVTAAGRGFDTTLINFDLACPILDKWFKIPNTTLDKVKDARGVGIMTFGVDLNPDLAAKILIDYGWGIKYLPAGNKLGNIGTPDIELSTLEQVIQRIYRREVNSQPAVTIIDASSMFELPTTYAALRSSSILLIPVVNKQEHELVNEQLAELKRLKVKPTKIIEVVWGDLNVRSKNTQVKIPYLAETLYQSSNQRKPYCYLLDESPFEKLLEVATGG
ncbi:hypothetical protein [Desulfoscipio gibsoniae]